MGDKLIIVIFIEMLTKRMQKIYRNMRNNVYMGES